MNNDELEILRSLNRNVDGLRGEVKAESRMRRRWIYLVSAVSVVFFVINSVLVIKLWDARAEDCEQGNASRAAIVQAFDQFVTALAAAASQPTDPAAKAQRDAQITTFRHNVNEGLTALAPRDCSTAVVNG